MRQKAIYKHLIATLVGLSFSLSSVAQAEAPVVNLNHTKDMSLEQRVNRLENILAAQKNVGMYNQLQTLQNQVSKLQGENDRLNYQLKRLQSQVKQQYTDLDKRLAQVKSGKTNITVAAAELTKQHDLYQKAYRYIKASEFVKADKAFKQYLQKYPKGQYAPNATYWLGETAIAQGNIPSALSYFKAVASKYPSTSKVPDALLKLGTIYGEMGNKTQAKQELTKIIKHYPKSPAAKLAKSQLAKLK